uniref:multiple organellar RNA editing factor 8, chloroplastic/mitochondrial n=1 Tax=Erigeron canadensis TaxID=72917 RepID=UPI001CB9926B|nr:multiple organellar RNA editing factor 8, chloroplastic/mitochondrial [Erigeron canadensis]
MATRYLCRNLSTITRSIKSSSHVLRIRPLTTLSSVINLRQPAVTSNTFRAFSTRQTTSSLNDSNPNWSNRPPKETILLDGCDFEHWLVVVEKPQGEPTRDEIIDSYINTLAQIVGSYDAARMKIYSVSTRCYYAFGALVSEEDSYKLKELPGVRWVLPDSYLDVKNKDYGGEPFIDGVAVPYDPRYHEEWIRNNARANERNRRNDRPRNFDRSRNIERRRENMQTNRGSPNMGGSPPPSSNMGAPPSNNMGGPVPNNMGGPPSNNIGGPPPSNYRGPPNMGGPPPGNMGGPPSMGGPPHGNMGGPPSMGGPPPGNMGRPSNMGGPPPHNMAGRPQGGPPNMGGVPPNNWNGPPQPYNSGSPNMGGGMPPPNNMGGMRPPNMGGGMQNNAPNYQHQGHYGPNNGGVPYQSGLGPNGYPPNAGGGNPYQNQDVQGRDIPPAANYQ